MLPFSFKRYLPKVICCAVLGKLAAKPHRAKNNRAIWGNTLSAAISMERILTNLLQKISRNRLAWEK
ncbi:hypothetical protein VC87395_000300 [Vibrio paracholerae 87395]|nr:hypothetical protein VC87395_000300 [Vibrio paracholerae 87395]